MLGFLPGFGHKFVVTYADKAVNLQKCQKWHTYYSFGLSEGIQELEVGAKMGHVGAS